MFKHDAYDWATDTYYWARDGAIQVGQTAMYISAKLTLQAKTR